jgi:dihydrofolate reductase
MRKLIYAINLTLDGCCDHTKGMADAELHDFYAKLLLDADTFVYGRKTYELMVPFWPDMAKNNSGDTKAMNDFAHAFNSVKNIFVFSRTLSHAEHHNTTIVRGDLRQEILRLKQQGGKNILTGGVDVPSQLIELGLVDEFLVVIQPLIVGEGRRLLDKATLHQKLKLVDSTALRSGSLVLRYAKHTD